MAKDDVFISVITVFDNAGEYVPEFAREVSDLLEARYSNFEILLVEGGSFGPPRPAIADLLAHNKCIRLLRLTRQVEYERALVAGLDAAIGDFVVIMDAESDPTSEVPAMVDQCRAGVDAVLGVDLSQSSGPLLRVARGAFFAIIRKLVRIEPVRSTTGFRVLSRHAVNALTRIRQRLRYFPLLAAEVGLTIATHPCPRITRSGKRYQESLRRALRIGISVIVFNSSVPLRFVSLLGLTGSLLSFAYSLFVIVNYLTRRDLMPGWTTLSLQVSGLFALVFIILMLLCEYVARVLEESSDRPLYYVREEVASTLVLADPVRRNVLDRSRD
jgi:glycosyltransferase involved in cell wall biosynthesis